MPLEIDDAEIIQGLEHLSRSRGVSKIEVLRAAVRAEIERDKIRPGVRERLAPVLEKASKIGTPSKPLSWEEEKRESDELWGE